MSSLYEYSGSRIKSSLKAGNYDCLNLLNLVKQEASSNFYQDDLAAVSEVLLCEILGKKRTQLYLEAPVLSQKEFDEFEYGLNSILLGEPLGFILGKADFFGLEFCLDENCFIPRPETEILVEKTLDVCRASKKKELSIYDFCTGTGNIAVSLTKALSYCRITATDISRKALKFARKNALWHKVAEKIDFICCDLANGIKKNAKADIIVSNPPYIKSSEINFLPENVRREPIVALDGGEDGLCVIRRLFEAARIYLRKGGYLIFEFGNDQTETIKNISEWEGIFFEPQIIEGSGNNQKNTPTPQIIKDYNGMDRVFIAKKV